MWRFSPRSQGRGQEGAGTQVRCSSILLCSPAAPGKGPSPTTGPARPRPAASAAPPVGTAAAAAAAARAAAATPGARLAAAAAAGPARAAAAPAHGVPARAPAAGAAATAPYTATAAPGAKPAACGGCPPPPAHPRTFSWVTEDCVSSWTLSLLLFRGGGGGSNPGVWARQPVESLYQHHPGAQRRPERNGEKHQKNPTKNTQGFVSSSRSVSPKPGPSEDGGDSSSLCSATTELHQAESRDSPRSHLVPTSLSPVGCMFMDPGVQGEVREEALASSGPR